MVFTLPAIAIGNVFTFVNTAPDATNTFTVSPNSTAFFATSPAAIITLGFDVFVQLVIAAITMSPDSNCCSPLTISEDFLAIEENEWGTSSKKILS